ncbi:amidohydrolase family protein [Longispora urticae]
MRILTGTDTGNPGVTGGAGRHGRTRPPPADALTAATANPATTSGLDGRGRVLPGRRADLLLVRGETLTDVTETRDIVAISSVTLT